MLSYIIEEPGEESSHERGHSIPFFSDMAFSYNRISINNLFFRSEAQDDAANVFQSIGKKSSPQQMIDVFMTPQSEDDFYEEGISSDSDSLSPLAGGDDDKEKPERDSGQQISTFFCDDEINEAYPVLKKNNEPHILVQTSSYEKEAIMDVSIGKETNNNRNEVEEKLEGGKTAETTEGDVSEVKSELNRVDNEVAIFSDTIQATFQERNDEGEETTINTKETHEGADDEIVTSDEKLSRYLEESKDSDAPQLCFDDEDGETICEMEADDILEIVPKE